MKKPRVLSFEQWLEVYYLNWEENDSGITKDDLKTEYKALKNRQLKLYKNWMRGISGTKRSESQASN